MCADSSGEASMFFCMLDIPKKVGEENEQKKADAVIRCIRVNREGRNIPKLQGNEIQTTRLNKNDHRIVK